MSKKIAFGVAGLAVVALIGFRVASAASFTFNTNLSIGMRGNDVTELQARLISENFLEGVTTPTGYFGPITFAGVKKYQDAHGIIYITGYVGPLTRAKLNANTGIQQ